MTWRAGSPLERTTRQIRPGALEEKFGAESPEYKMAFDALSKWDARSKVMQTEWHKTGQAQQGETDLDTGTFTGLQRAYKDITDKDFTPKQAKEANEKASGVRNAEADADAARKKLYAEADKSKVPEKPVETHKAGTPWEAGQVKDLWKRARSYIDKGEERRFRFHPKQVGDRFGPVCCRRHARTDPTRKRQTRCQRCLDETEEGQESETAGIPMAVCAVRSKMASMAWINSIRSFPGSGRIAWHGCSWHSRPGTGVSTSNAGQPISRITGACLKMVGSPTFHEMQVQDLVRRPNYIPAQRAGLQNNPFGFEDYTSPDFIKALEQISPALWLRNLKSFSNPGTVVTPF